MACLYTRSIRRVGSAALLDRVLDEMCTIKTVGKGNNSDNWASGQVALEIPIPCPEGVGKADCTSPPPIFPGEDDVHTVDTPKPPPL